MFFCSVLFNIISYHSKGHLASTCLSVNCFILFLAERAGRCDIPVKFSEMVIEISVSSQDLSGHSKTSLAHLE